MPGKQELLDGELISLPPAENSHSIVARAFQNMLLSVLDKSRVWFYEGYQLKRGWLIPDVSVIRPNRPVSKWFQGAPLIAIEIVSTGNTAAQIETLRITDTYHCELIGVVVKLDELLPGVWRRTQRPQGHFRSSI